jgi:hypothetical protein
MIRIYLDWNVISNLKRPEYKELKDFIDEHKEHFLFPYSPAHFKDLMKSFLPDNDYFEQDIKTLEYLSGEHLIRWEDSGTEFLLGTPLEYLEGEKNKDDYFSFGKKKKFKDLNEVLENSGLGKVGEVIKGLYKIQPSGIEVTDENKEMLQKIFPKITSNSSMWDLMNEIEPFIQNLLFDKDFYKDFRKLIGDKGFKIDPNSGNWSEEEVIDKISLYIKSFGVEMDFIEFVKFTFKYRKKPPNRFEFFTTAYFMLDLIGYKSDKLPKPSDNWQNISTDGEHAFYGAHCDFFIVGDKKLKVKSKVLYNKFNLQTQILAPNEFIEVIEKQLHTFPNSSKTNLIDEAFSFIDLKNSVEVYPFSEENEVDTYAVKLPIFYFNFFNYAVYSNYINQQGVALTFKRVFKNYSKFLYYTEEERIVDLLTNLFGYEDKEELILKKKEFVYEDKDTEFHWYFEGGMIILDKDLDTRRPNLTYLITYKK